MKKRSSPLDKVLGRLDGLDSVNLTNLVQRLARERRLLETVFNTIQDGILVIDDSGVIQFANQAAARLIGFSLDEIGSALFWKWVPDLHRTLRPDLAENAPGAPRPVLSRELELDYPEPRSIRFFMVPLPEPVGRTRYPGWAIVLSDITESKRSTDRRIEDERLDSVMNLAAGVAHELGNPLNSLDIHLQLLARQSGRLPASPTREKISQQVAICRSELTRLDGIIENFLEAVRPRPPDLSAELDLHEALAEVLKVIQAEIDARGVQVEVEVTSGFPVIRADRNQIKQVLFNLLKNSLEAVADHGRIILSTAYDEHSVTLSLTDNGPGIPADILPRIFEPYFTTKKGGHGLGMMIVHRIVRDHGGSISIDSTPGHGARVALSFPRKDRLSRLLQSPSSPPSPRASPLKT